MKAKHQNIGLKSFLDKLEKYKEDNIIFLEVLNTAEQYLGEYFREDKLRAETFFAGLNIINSCKQELKEIEESYINRLLIKKKQNQTLKDTIKSLINKLHDSAKQNWISHNIYNRFKEYVEFTQKFYLDDNYNLNN